MIRPITAAAGLCLAGATFLPTPAMAAVPEIQLCVTVPSDAKNQAEFQVAASNPDKHIVAKFKGPDSECKDPVEVNSSAFQVTAAVIDTGCPALNVGKNCHVPKFSHFLVTREGGDTQRINSGDSSASITPPSDPPVFPGGKTTVTAVFINS